MLDVVVKGGAVIDGSGGPRRRADVGIVGDRIVEIGTVTAEAERTIDATGSVVTPGFIDVHTHYDAQVFWDGALTPSPLFGFTTVFAGNCGFSIAPLPPDTDGRGYLMRMLGRVEAIPMESLESGVPWNWDTTRDYLDAIDGATALNIGFMVGHSAIRRCVMGDDAVKREATDSELDAMKRLLAEGLEAGGLGLSSSWARTHFDAEGAMVPSRLAARRELLELSSVLAGYSGVSLEFIPMIAPEAVFEPWAVELMADMSAAAGAPLNWNVLTLSAESVDAAHAQLRARDVARDRGGRVFALTLPRNLSLRLNFSSGFILDAFPGWTEFIQSTPTDKLATLADPAERARLDASARSPENDLGAFADWAATCVFDVAAPENEVYRGRLIGDIATELGRDPFDVLCDIVIADELRTSFGRSAPDESTDDWNAHIGVWRERGAVIGGSDAGAHVDMLAGFDYPVRVLSRAVRDKGLLPIEEAVHYFTDVPARLYGVRDRGRLEEGWYADLVVLDPDRVDSDEPRMVYDLPGGAGRLFSEPVGIDHVLVNGRAVVSDGVLTSDRPGTVLRSGRDTAPSTLSC